MRRALVVLCLSACGRIGIDARSDGAVTLLDTASDTPLGPDALIMEVANSFEEWEPVQGSDGWYYGAWNLTVDGDGGYDPLTDFELFNIFPGELFRPATWEAEPSTNFTWAYLGRTLIHPGSYPEERYPMRRWVSDFAGPATVTLTLAKSDASGGDGVVGFVYVDGVKRYERLLDGMDSAGFVDNVPIDVAVGSNVDVMLGFNGGDAIDTTNMTVSISTR